MSLKESALEPGFNLLRVIKLGNLTQGKLVLAILGEPVLSIGKF
ncbi:MAG: hypothetical protein NTV12_10355 [Verrucomicrobia bacterium]|nr:hypothetical protein [Verrucomicrobiota bacterium]